MEQHRHLIKYALSAKCTISVFDGEEWSTKKSTNKAEIIDDIEGCDCPQIKIRDKDNNVITLVAIFIDRDDYTVQDYTVCDFMSDWDDCWSELYDKQSKH